MLVLWAHLCRDLSMILCDPFAINTLSLSTVRHLQELVGQEMLPRVSALGWPHCLLDGHVGVDHWQPGLCCPGESTHTPCAHGAWSLSKATAPGPC